MTLLLQPGDMLYLPPRVAHHGVATEEGFTYSVGFLAPRHRDLLLSYAAAAGEAQRDARWMDPWLAPASRPGELSAQAVDAAVALVSALPRDRASIAAGFVGGKDWAEGTLGD